MKKISLLFVICSFFLLSCDNDSEGDSFGSLENWSYGFVGGENYKEYAENPFVNVSEQPISTFSVDADGASYSNARRFLNLGQRPPKESVRIEEYLNYFTYDYPEPQGDELVSYHSEVSACPWNSSHLLIRIGLKGKTIPEEQLPPSNYVFLIDVSGSMNSSDKLGLLQEGFLRLVDNLSPQDRVAIVTYAGNSGVVLESTSCDQKEVIKKAIRSLSAQGSTNGHGGITKAYEIAEKNKIPLGNNRIILGTDGDFNTGPSTVKELIELVEEKRESGVFITVLGVGQGNLNDYMGEQIANNGNGTYEYIDCIEQMDKVFIHEKSKLYTVAKDTKVQLTFNPARVEKYRLIGYENRMIEKPEEFEDDKKDGGEIGVGQTITAIYEVSVFINQLYAPLATMDIRYKKATGNDSKSFTYEILPTLGDEKASENMRFATAVTAFGLLMRDSEYKGETTLPMVLDLAQQATSYDPNGYRAEFIKLVQNIKK